MNRFPLLLLALVTLALGGLSGASWLALRAEVDRLALTAEAALRAQALTEVRRIEGFALEAGVTALDRVEAAAATGLWELRCLQINSNCLTDPDDLVAFAVMLDAEGARVYPPTIDIVRTFTEQQLWQRSARFLSLEGSAKPDLDWIITADGPGLCRQDDSGARTCAGLDRTALETWITAKLDQHPPALAIRLSRAKGDRLWQSEGLDASEVATNSLPLTGALEGLNLQAFEAKDTAMGSPLLLGALAIFLPGGLVLIGLALFLYRDQTTRMASLARRSERARDLSHELRTPLTNIRLYLDMIRKAPDAAKREAHCHTVAAEIERLDGLIDGALRAVRESDRPDRGLVAIDVDGIAGQLCDRFQPLMSAHGVGLIRLFEVHRAIPVERSAFEQILVNLLDNVRRHATGSEVTIATRIEGDMLELAVQNRGGEGLSEDGRPHGHGLGICARLMEGVGGDFRSETTDQGFSARARFPLGSAR